MEHKIIKIEEQLTGIKELLVKLNNNMEELNKKVDNLKENVVENLVGECKKMGEHIDFIENVYENVKHPLGYICKKVKYLTGNSSMYNENNYTLEDSNENTV